MIQGIGNPLVAVYARCYLCRVGLSVSPVNAKFLLRNFECFLETYQHVSIMLVTVYDPVFTCVIQLFSRGVKADLHRQKITLSTYMTLYTPALDFIMENVVTHSTESVLGELLSKCKDYSNRF